MRKSRIDRLWSAWMVVGVLACVLYATLPAGNLAQGVLSATIEPVSFAVALIGILRNRPARPAGWYVFIAALAAEAAGGIVYAADQFAGERPPFPSAADWFFLGAYPLLMAGLFLIAGGGRARRDLPSMIDSAIIATGTGLVIWVTVIGPMAADTGTPPFTRAVSLAFPAFDVLVFAVVARLLTRQGKRTLSLKLLIAGAALVLAGDLLYLPAAMLSAYTGGIISAAFQFAMVCFAGAALHPSVRNKPQAERESARQFGPFRFAVLTLAVLLAPAVLFIQGADGGVIDWLAVGIGAVVLFVLMLIRMSGFVTQVQAQSRQLEDLAMRDELTGLANRRRFELRLTEAVAAGTAQVCLLDLTDFKGVNDRFGHAVGDDLLVVVAARLAGALRAGDLVARMGGDEFAILVPRATPAEGDEIVGRLAAALRGPIELGEHEFLISASIGVADARDTGDPSEVLRRADVAMYAAKNKGERHRRYAPEMDEVAGERSRLGAEIQNGLDTGQFRLVYQPIVALPEGRTVSVEALVRWDHPARGFVSPAEFIPVAEQNGLIVELGEWILRTACAQAVVWRDTLGAAAPRRVAVNVSARQLAEPGFVDLVAAVLAETGLGAEHLTIEVTETAVFGRGRAVQAVRDLHRLGVGIALDDFGTGHSSLGLLQTVPVDVLKVDKSFVDNLTMAGRHAVIATALIQVANGLGLSAVAEGVETAEQAAELHRLGYRLAQGYHFGKPTAEPRWSATPEKPEQKELVPGSTPAVSTR